MTNQQILERAIQKAIDGGWTWHEHPQGALSNLDTKTIEYYGLNKNPVMVKHLATAHPYDVIYDHDFARALWGEGKVCEYYGHEMGKNEIYCKKDDEYQDTFACGSEASDLERWQYHLQQMVIADDPIKYLGEYMS